VRFYVACRTLGVCNIGSSDIDRARVYLTHDETGAA
jgi:hypothetical protein